MRVKLVCGKGVLGCELGGKIWGDGYLLWCMGYRGGYMNEGMDDNDGILDLTTDDPSMAAFLFFS